MAALEPGRLPRAFAARLALALAASSYLAIALDEALHEAGHLLAAILLGGKASLYLAPLVVGGVYWIPPESGWDRTELAWLMAAGPLTGILLGSLLLLAAWRVTRRCANWAAAWLAWSAASFLLTNAAYPLASLWLEWGDGYELLRLGLAPLWIYLACGLVLCGPGLLALLLALRAFEAYTPLRSGTQIWALLVSLYAPVYLYAMLKAYLFLPGYFERLRLQFILIPLFAIPVAPLLARLRRGAPQPLAAAPLSKRTAAILAGLAAGVEIFAGLYFGFEA